MIHGAFSFAVRNRSRTRAAPTPTNISTKSEPDNEKKGVPASPATALARSVLPVPGGPTSNTPLGSFPPRRVNFSGFCRNSTTSATSSLASSIPATSLKVSLLSAIASNSTALFLPMFKICEPGFMRLIMNTHSATMIASGKIHARIPPIQFSSRRASKTTTVRPSAALSTLKSIRNWISS